jgi:hypothetical protein
MLGRKRKKKERGNKDMQGLQYYNAVMLQYCNAAIPTLQLPAISKWANWSAKQNLHHQKQHQQGKATSMSKQNTSPSQLILELSSGDSMELSSRANRLGMGRSTKTKSWLGTTWTEHIMALDKTSGLSWPWLVQANSTIRE